MSAAGSHCGGKNRLVLFDQIDSVQHRYLGRDENKPTEIIQPGEEVWAFALQIPPSLLPRMRASYQFVTDN